METITLAEVVKATQGRTILEFDSTVTLRGISTDSRTIRTGELFVALKGPHFEGHTFVEETLNRGAPAAVVAEGWKPSERRIERQLIWVTDALRALQDLAESYRKRFLVRVVGVTGSNGKTTTKEMIATVLATRHRVLKSEGNLNNQIGIPLTIFKLDSQNDIAVMELGMSASGEIARLCEIARPEVGVITNVGPAHLESLGNMENVAEAKMEILRALDERGYGVVNGDDPLILSRLKGLKAKISTFGFGEACEIHPDRLLDLGDGAHGFEVGGIHIALKVPGRHNVMNALAAIAVGRIYGITDQETGEALAGFKPTKMRMEILETKGIRLLNDSYNANPASMAAALETLSSLAGTRRLAVLGDMLELGDVSGEAHWKVGDQVAGRKIDILVTLGERAKGIAAGAEKGGVKRIQMCLTKEEVIDFMREILKPGDVVLVKGSRGMKMEKIVDALVEGLR